MNGSRSGNGLFVRLGFLALMIMVALGNRGCEENYNDPRIGCGSPALFIQPGTCATFQNPCANNQWLQVGALSEGFRFAPETDEQRLFVTASEVSVLTTREDDGTGRSVCVGQGAPLAFQEEVPFLYFRRSNYGRGSLFLTIAPVLTVTATASPSAIAAGESAQLVAHVSGGIPPYFYSWVPGSTLDDNDIAAPIASPNFTTEYTVGVTDSGGQQKVSSVTVFVDFDIAVTANPDLINVGEPSQLLAVPVGGTPPYTFSWTPTDGLDDPLYHGPVAKPATTTTYTALVTDATGATRQGSATVRIRDLLPLTADFVYNIQCCPIVDLNASASTGNIVSYTWELSWTAASPDRVTTNPFTSFTFNEIDRGTITLTVTGADGNTATRTRGFPSPGASPNGRSRVPAQMDRTRSSRR